MAKTGETRKTKQPLKIDRLPPSVHESIALLRNQYGKTWEQIEALSTEKFDPKLVPLGCFVDWDNLDTEVLALFPDRRIPKSNLQRWHDIRIEQVRREVLHRSAQARELAVAFAGANVKDADEAVQNATRDTIMGMLAEDTSQAGRDNTVQHLLKLAEIQQKAKTNKIRERQVDTDERRITILEREAQQRLERMNAEAAKLTKKASKGEVTPADIDRLRERVFGLPPKAQEA